MTAVLAEFTLNGERFTTDLPSLCGAQIKARLADVEPGSVLLLESHTAAAPDRVVGDLDTVTIDGSTLSLIPPSLYG